jgi:molybdate/tungstate transport system ATP-binding protein
LVFILLDVEVSLKRRRFTLEAQIHDSGSICLSGPNGSGKSTLLNVIAGILKPSVGYIRVNSKDVTKLPIERRGVVLVNPESMIPHLDVERHLVWGAKVRHRVPSPELVREATDSLGITYSGRVDALSLGMRERVSLATALLAKPEVILVDEAFSNIDRRDGFIARYASMCKRDSIDLVFATQDPADASLAEHHYRIGGGVTVRVR